MGVLKRLVIHCTATEAGREVTKAEIFQWHLHPPPIGNGWSVVGYSEMIHLNGEIEKLRDYNEDNLVEGWEITNGVYGYNSSSRHIVYVGGLRNGRSYDTRTIEQMASLEYYVKLFRLVHPECEIVGHNDLNPNKDCPCFNVKNWLMSLR